MHRNSVTALLELIATMPGAPMAHRDRARFLLSQLDPIAWLRTLAK